MWWWRKVRRAPISDDLRTQFERYGETVVAHVVAAAPTGSDGGLLHELLNKQREAALDWLTERRDVDQRRQDRLETLEIAILVFLMLGVVFDPIFFAFMKPS